MQLVVTRADFREHAFDRGLQNHHVPEYCSTAVSEEDATSKKWASL